MAGRLLAAVRPFSLDLPSRAAGRPLHHPRPAVVSGKGVRWIPRRISAWRGGIHPTPAAVLAGGADVPRGFPAASHWSVCFPDEADEGPALRFSVHDFRKRLDAVALAMESTTATLLIWAWGQALAEATGTDAVIVEQVRSGAPQEGTAGFTMLTLPVRRPPRGGRRRGKTHCGISGDICSHCARSKAVSPADFPSGVFPDVDRVGSSVIMVEHATRNICWPTNVVESVVLHECQGRNADGHRPHPAGPAAGSRRTGTARAVGRMGARVGKLVVRSPSSTLENQKSSAPRPADRMRRELFGIPDYGWSDGGGGRPLPVRPFGRSDRVGSCIDRCGGNPGSPAALGCRGGQHTSVGCGCRCSLVGAGGGGARARCRQATRGERNRVVRHARGCRCVDLELLLRTGEPQGELEELASVVVGITVGPLSAGFDSYPRCPNRRRPNR